MSGRKKKLNYTMAIFQGVLVIVVGTIVLSGMPGEVWSGVWKILTTTWYGQVTLALAGSTFIVFFCTSMIKLFIWMTRNVKVRR